jgi:hypothetical protein
MPYNIVVFDVRVFLANPFDKLRALPSTGSGSLPPIAP